MIIWGDNWDTWLLRTPEIAGSSSRCFLHKGIAGGGLAAVTIVWWIFGKVQGVLVPVRVRLAFEHRKIDS